MKYWVVVIIITVGVIASYNKSTDVQPTTVATEPLHQYQERDIKQIVGALWRLSSPAAVANN